MNAIKAVRQAWFIPVGVALVAGSWFASRATAQQQGFEVRLIAGAALESGNGRTLTLQKLQDSQSVCYLARETERGDNRLNVVGFSCVRR